MTESILRLPEVKSRTGLSRTHIYLLMQGEKFPRQIKLGARAVGWLSTEIDGWLEDRIAESRSDCAQSL